MPSIKDLQAGQRYGVLTAVKYSHRQDGNIHWLFACDCGTVKPMYAWSVLSGRQDSCGCLGRKRRVLAKTKHGHRRKYQKQTKEYTAWLNIKHRCYDSNRPDYNRYGGRGIKVCDRWLESFANFLEDMGYAPPGTSIDRIDVNGDYEPNNCRWASKWVQASNKRNNTVLHFNGQSKTVSEWARALGISRQTLTSRLNQSKWDVEKALTVAVGKESICKPTMTLTLGGETKSVKEWSLSTGLPTGLIYRRLKRGWEDSKVLTTRPMYGDRMN